MTRSRSRKKCRPPQRPRSHTLRLLDEAGGTPRDLSSEGQFVIITAQGNQAIRALIGSCGQRLRVTHCRHTKATGIDPRQSAGPSRAIGHVFATH